MVYNKLCLLVEVATVKFEKLKEREVNKSIHEKTNRLICIARYLIYSSKQSSYLIHLKVEEILKPIFKSIDFMEKNYNVGTCDEINDGTEITVKKDGFFYNRSTITFTRGTQDIQTQMMLKYGRDGKFDANYKTLTYPISFVPLLYNLKVVDEETLENYKKVDREMEMLLNDAISDYNDNETVDQNFDPNQAIGFVEMDYLLDITLEDIDVSTPGKSLSDELDELNSLDIPGVLDKLHKEDGDYEFTMPNGDSGDLLLFTAGEFRKYVLELASSPAPFDIKKRKRINYPDNVKRRKFHTNVEKILDSIVVERWEDSYYKFRGSTLFNSLFAEMTRRKNTNAHFMFDITSGSSLIFDIVSHTMNQVVEDGAWVEYMASKCNFGVMFVTISIDVGMNHANVLVFDKKTRKVLRFEPHGETRSYNARLVDLHFELFLLKNFNGFEYVAPSKFLDVDGPQTKETNSTKYSPKLDSRGLIQEELGFCVAWCLVWIHLVINTEDIQSNYNGGLDTLSNDECALLIRKHAAFLYEGFLKAKEKFKSKKQIT